MPPPRAALPPTVRSPRTRRTNRLALGLVGLVAFACGGAGLATGFGAFGASAQHRSVLTTASNYADSHAWVWAAVAAAGLVLAAVALAWLVAQFGSNRITDLDLTDDPQQGRTSLASGAVSDAVRSEIETYPGIRSATARLVTERGTPTLLVSTALDGRTPPGEVRRRIQSEALAHARRALDDPGLPARLERRLSRRSGRRVR
ncbi:MAG TPA: hypothetical protein VIS06_15100 [Mycobacteriales bacterium]